MKPKPQLKQGHCGDCRFMASWTENQSPLGSGECWLMSMSECVNEDALDCEFEDGKCQYWQGVEFAYCADHDEWYLKSDVCGGCLQADFEEGQRLADEYLQGKARRLERALAKAKGE